MKRDKIKKERKEYIKKVKKSRKNWKTIHLTCTKCKKSREITTTSPEIYTPEIFKTYICIFCKYKVKRT